jgi:opacity protein-like surface antigen
MRLSVSLTALLLAGSASPAVAADYRLPPPPPLPEASVAEFNWGGLYGGIHVNTTSADFSASNDLSGLAATAYLRHPAQPLALATPLTVPNSGSNQQNGIGGFVGFNWLWEDVVVGFEADFTHMKDTLASVRTTWPNPDTISAYRGNLQDVITYSGVGKAELSDYLILKARGGYAIGRFLPYGTVGIVIAQQRHDVFYSSLYTQYIIDPVTGARTGTNVANEPHTAAYTKSGYNYGLALGVGVDYALLDNLFLRAEYQYLGMADFHQMRTNANTFRLGAGLKY